MGSPACTLQSDRRIEAVAAGSTKLHRKSMNRIAAIGWNQHIGCQRIMTGAADQRSSIECAAQLIIATKSDDNIAVGVCTQNISAPRADDQIVDGTDKGKPIEILRIEKNHCFR